MSSKKQARDPGQAAAKRPDPSASRSVEGANPQAYFATLIQRARNGTAAISPKEVMQLQRMIGNRAVGELLTGGQQPGPIQKKASATRLPANLKSGLESLSGMSMDDVRVHYNSARPAQVQAAAYTQGTDIHVAPGQERHLPHEGWHVAQQKQGRVQPTVQINGMAINDDAALEHEADVMGVRALQVQPMPEPQDSPTLQRWKQAPEAVPKANIPPFAQHHILQREYGSRAVQRMLASLPDAAPAQSAPVMGSGVIQRTVDTDLQEAANAYHATKGYQSSVEEGLEQYHAKIKKAEKEGFPDLQDLAEGMARGFKSWAVNYYNKTQAYLYEGQKANDFTHDPNFAILGVDTDLNPDLEVHTLCHQSKTWTSSAIEFKASTSDYGAVAKLVGAGLDQLRKREQQGSSYGDAFGKLILTVHNDNPTNSYPFTQQMVNNDHGGDVASISTADWNARLTTLLAGAVVAKGITSTLEVRMEYQGTRYATALFNG